MNGIVVKNNVVKNDIVKAHLVQQIDNLKSDIQHLLDKKKEIQKDEMVNWSEVKQQKMSQLKSLTEKLKEINKQERVDLKRRNELNLVSKTIDNLEYAAAKKKNNSVAMDKAKREKEIRNEAREQYIKFQLIEQKYLKYDSDKLPANLFLHTSILKSYGLCPFLDINIDDETSQSGSDINIDKITDEIYNMRLKWLKDQSDGGILYFELFDDLIKQTELYKMYDTKTKLENTITNFIRDNITNSQMVIYDNCTDFIKEYVNCSIKTKRIKERYNLFINDLSVLYSETSIEFHTYLSVKYNLHIVVNILDTNKKAKEQFIILDQFDELIKKYKSGLELINKKELFTKNTLKNVKMDLYYFLTDKQNFLSKSNNLNLLKSNSIIQTGKYFKRWSVLSLDEQIERFKSFSCYYVDKNLINTLIIDKNKRDEVVEILFVLLKTNFENRRMVYRDYIWNTKRGIIETVKILQYNKDTGFELSFTKQMPSKDGQLKHEQEKLNLEKEKGSSECSTNISKKKVSSRTIITKESEKIINEELLYFILKRIQNGTDEISKEDKEEFADKIKIKLKVKKLMLNDKTKIYNKYDEIFEVVKNNKN